ncbi:MAG: hypothetical protein RLZZ303_1464 [Candidatus Hydrogenedentota bacterium]|jgi:acyl-CoA thioester hydrolase
MPPLPFRYFLRVRYGECDAQKVVFNARYGDYIELSTTEFMRALGYDSELVTGDLDYQLVKQTIEWKSPARFDDVIEARVWAHHIGNTSFTIHAEFRRAGEEPLLAKAETVYVLVDAATLKKKPIEEALRRALERGPVDRVTDHAGHTCQNREPGV